MKIHLFASFACYIFLGFISFLDVSMAAGSLKYSQSVTINEPLISLQEEFQLGFFNRSSRFYLGIWYNKIPDQTPVWIANRDNPLNDSSGVLRIGDDGNLILFHGAERIWSTSVKDLSPNTTVVQLLDTGNLVLRDSNEGNFLWQSFDHPSHAIVAGMKFGWDSKTNLNRKITSWKSSDDPSSGEYTFGFDLHGLPQAVIWKGSVKHFRSGPWNGKDFGGLFFVGDLPFTSEAVANTEEVYCRYNPRNNSLILVEISYLGVIDYKIWDIKKNIWQPLFSVSQDRCGHYESCGPNSVCSLIDAKINCTCFDGYIPNNTLEWSPHLYNAGCVRKYPLNCSKGEDFKEVTRTKMPDLLQFWLNPNISLEECKAECLRNCSCTAYANSDATGGGSGCILWFGDLVDVRKLSNYADQTLYVRVSAADRGSEPEPKPTKTKKLVVIVVAITTSVLILLAVLFLILRRKSIKGRQQPRHMTEKENLELPCFDMATVIKATSNFSGMNKIGEGGYGPVYKGVLSNGQQVAVKRLSKDSCQGLCEYKNEVMVIAKLQHRNLVRLLGCCIQENERILIYEYMPNGSLDSYIFGGLSHRKKHLLVWRRRFSIIEGIARGLLYLHHDSRLRIIHRDLKASNVLLDSEMNPKISDFGMARTFGEEQSTTKTRMVVGTYGYMAPEYATRGIFSMKSDVFSFGVLVLEIISGERNSQFYHPDHDLNLVGHAWKLWIEGRASDLIDPMMGDSFPIAEVLRCIQVGLLCVQKKPEERPVMSTVLLMLDSETAVLPQPHRPGFYIEKCFSDETEDRLSGRLFTTNYLSDSSIEGR